jgi:hypothetical protein
VIYAQVARGQKLHLAYEPGEGIDAHHLIPRGSLGKPLCGRIVPNGYRMTINVPLANACKRCLRVYEARKKEAGK